MAAQTEVPEGTTQDVLDWVDGDPQRAQTALEAENCKDNPRSTLVTKLETIADKEAPVSDQSSSTATEEAPRTHETSVNDERSERELQEEAGLAPGPEQPEEVEIYPEDKGTTLLATSVRDGDVEPEGTFAGNAEAVQEQREKEREEREEDFEAVGADQVEYLDAVIAGHGAVIAINGTPYAFNKGMVGSLKQIVDKAVVGLAL